MIDRGRTLALDMRTEAKQVEAYAARLRRAADLLDPPDKPAKAARKPVKSKAGKGTAVSAATVDRVVEYVLDSGATSVGPAAQRLGLSASAVRAAMEVGRKQERIRLKQMDGTVKVYEAMSSLTRTPDVPGH